MIFREISAQEYDLFARKHPQRNYLNSRKAFLVKEKAGFDCTFVGVLENDEIIAASGLAFVPCLRKFYYAYAQRGLLVDYGNKEVLSFFVKELKEYLKKKDIIYLKIDPYVPYQERDIDGNVVEDGFNNTSYIQSLENLGFKHQGFTTGFDNDSQCRFMVVLNLKDKDEETLLKEMDSQTRWCVRKAMKLGIKVKTLSKDELHIFKQIIEESEKKHDFEDMSIESYVNQMDIYGNEDAKVCMSYIDLEDMQNRIQKDREVEENNLKALEDKGSSKKTENKRKAIRESLQLLEDREKEILELKEKHDKIVPLSVAYFVFYEDEAVYVSSGSQASLKKYNGPYAIQWAMIQESLKRNCTRYNFYGTSGVFTKEAEDYGVFNFKKGFNAFPEELLGDFILPVNKAMYTLYSSIKALKK